MKNFFKVAVCLLMAMGIVACGEASTEKQEAVVTNFFEYLKAGDVDKIATICTDDNSDVDDLLSIMESLEEYMDVEIYGQTFVDEANKFVDHVFANYVTSYEINSVEAEGDNYLVIADIKMKDYNNIDIDSDTTTIIDNYQQEHLDELSELAGDQQAMMEKSF